MTVWTAGKLAPVSLLKRLPELMPKKNRPAMIISKDMAVLLKSINTLPSIATKVFNKRHRFLWDRKTET